MPHDLTPTELSLRGSAASETSWANTTDRAARTKPGRDAAFQKFLDEIDERFPGLDPADRRKRAEHLQKAHMARLALASAKARRKAAADRLLAERVLQGLDVVPTAETVAKVAAVIATPAERMAS